MYRHLLISVYLIDDRYHGANDWPPSPARVFQALVAAAARGGTITASSQRALQWLERLDPPIVAAPHKHDGEPVLLYVPNNDLDSVGGDTRRIGELRVGKLVEPRLLTPGVPVMYAWRFDDAVGTDSEGGSIASIVDGLYQLGRGVDMAWARAEIIDDDTLNGRLSDYHGVVHRPTPGGSRRVALACPQQGSLASLQRRFEALRRRFSWQGQGKKATMLFTQPPKARFTEVSYDSPSTQHLFELRDPQSPGSFRVWQIDRAHDLVVAVRNSVATRLRKAFPDLDDEIDRVIMGRNSDGKARVRFVPLPSIGHDHVDRGIRRCLVQVPNEGILTAEDVRWAVAAIDPGELDGMAIVPASDEMMLEHYGIGTRSGYRRWQSVTPVALPVRVAGRRGQSKRVDVDKGGAGRAAEEREACEAVAQAIRHAGLREKVVDVRVQREPFEHRGCRAEAFSEGTRFPKESLWHVSLELERPVYGPLMLGNGRYLGLGLMAPQRNTWKVDGIWAIEVVSGLDRDCSTETLSRALRRAVMSRAQALLPAGETLPVFFSGHESDGGRALQDHEHLAFLFDPEAGRFLIVAPHRLAPRGIRGDEQRWSSILSAALSDMTVLKAGSAGCLEVRQVVVAPEMPLLKKVAKWESLTPYVVTRHYRGLSAHDALRADIVAECSRIGLPEVEVDILWARGDAGVGLVGDVRLSFKSPVSGPLLLGRTRHLGGGVFRPS